MDLLPQVLILAGGLGMRLRNAVSDRPKCMVMIAGRPFLEYLILKLKCDGFQEFILSTGYLGELVQAHFGDGSRLGVSITYSQEESPLGTGGAVRKAEPLIRGDAFLAVNGDSLLAIDVRQLLTEHRTKPALATIALTEVPDASRYGTVELDPTGSVTRFAEKGNGPRPGLINGGMYVFSRQVLGMIPAGKAVSLERETMPALLDKGVRGLVSRSFFIDIGTPEDYRRLQENPEELTSLAGVATC